MAATNPLHDLMRATTLDKIGSPGKVITVDSDAELSNAFTTLVENNIQSAPVVDKSKDTLAYTGFLDVRDLVSFLKLIGEHMVEGDVLVADIVSAGIAGSVIDNVTTSYLSRRNGFKTVKDTDNLLDCVNILNTGAKRVAVLDQDNKCVNVITQSNVVKFISQHIDTLDEATKNGKLEDVIPSMIKPVFAVAHDVEACDAFGIMDRNKVTALAILDDNGCVVGNMTGKDTKLFIKNPSFKRLHMPVWRMVQELRMLSDIEIRVPAITATPSDSYVKTMMKFSATKIHRVFVVDSNNKPIGVVNLLDIIRGVVPPPAKVPTPKK